MRKSLQAVLVATLAASAVLAAAPRARADWDHGGGHEWRDRDWREHDWREHEWHRFHHQEGPFLYAPPPPVVYAPPRPRYYAPPPAYYVPQPGYYAPQQGYYGGGY